MNIAITDGVELVPPAFAEGLDVWSSGNGTPGSDTYDGDPNAVFVPSDQDFAGCLELYKTNATQKLRYMGETPLLPGAYLRVTARVKAVSGNLPSVRIAGWAGAAGGGHVSDVTETGPATALTTYGEVVEITAIIGTGMRVGVDMAWGTAALYGHFGVDLTGPTGGVVRIDDIVIEDITSAFLRDMLSLVDVRDFGALGDGTTDDTAAFAAANAAAEGRRVLVPAGIYQLDDSVTFDVPVIFEGTVTMPTDKMLLLTRNYDLASYVDAFGDEELAFKKAFQALLNNSDHAELDLGGRKVNLSGPVDMQAAVPNKDSYATRRVIRNGQLNATGGAAWDTETVTSQASYSASNGRTLSDVANVANIPVGALVEGNGVGREVYVTARNIGAQELTLSAQLHDAEGTQTYTFRDFKYMLDFSGFSQLSKFELTEVEIQCNGIASGIRLAPAGSVFSLHHCILNKPKDRGVTSIAEGCQGMIIDNCQFLSNEDALDVEDRVSIGLNVNANDVKLRHNRITRFLHFAVLEGQNHTVIGNHLFQGDTNSNGVRTAGIVLIGNYHCTTIAANYIDNCWIEWTNEHDSTPDFTSGFSFASLSITDNICLCTDVADWFSFIVIKPFGSGHYLNGLSVTGNKFRSISGSIDRVERIDSSHAPLDASRFKNVTFEANTFHQVSRQVTNPARVQYVEATPAKTWVVSLTDAIPFDGMARRVDSVVSVGAIKTAADQTHYGVPFIRTEQGGSGDKVDLVWEEEVQGEVALTVRIDL
ncbi:glycosyl hydrolase family 28-related protein [Albibacillus kandeliae]|uniref:glycosyl hydrolase family 28-related protein n=1 Tax=Albibacillus kandeliae TaxID=2174228 RepID=UPI000D69748C|nr:glycosyl hydrolase family 28-related protein [Albibacillus kandeliae]